MQYNISFTHKSLPLHMWFKKSVSTQVKACAVAAAVFAAPLSTVPQLAYAQNLFAPVITINDDVVTQFELNQRAQFFNLIGSPGDPAQTARAELINDALKRQALSEVGLVVPEQAVNDGISQLAAQANLDLNDFTSQMKQAGVDIQTIRDYTAINIGWRDYIRGRFLSQARPTEAEIQRAMGGSGAGGVEVLISEIFIPITPETAAQVEEVALQISEIRDVKTFGIAAGQFSQAESRTNGGQLPWMSITRLPPALQEIVLELDTGDVTSPMALRGAVALFQMRGLREAIGHEPTYSALEYVSYHVPGGRSPEALAQARIIRNNVDTCNDFYGLEKGQDPNVLERVTLPPSEIPRDIALELAKLDENETSSTLTRNQGETLMVLMLCGRTATTNTDDAETRSRVANALTQQRLSSLSASLVEQLRANARISE